MNVLLPVTRAWTRDAVVAAIAASDVPRGVVHLVLDAPGCGSWAPALEAAGFEVRITDTGNAEPPEDRLERRDRHRAMRRLTQRILPELGELLCLEDDTIVPPDVYARLASAGPNATGVQVSRHGSRALGVLGAVRRRGVDVEEIQACGHFCLRTTCEAYRTAPILPRGAVDAEHTSRIRPLVVDWRCVCGHLTEGGVLYP